DRIIILGKNEKKVYVHSGILGARSPYFANLFNKGFKESIDLEIYIDEDDESFFMSMIKLFYSGELNIHEDNWQKVLKKMNYYDDKELNSKCQKWIEDNIDQIDISKDNCRDLAELLMHCPVFILTAKLNEWMITNHASIEDKDYPTMFSFIF